jgi:succinate dehydrogenase / fumarate reductase iron-sulfur subunit
MKLKVFRFERETGESRYDIFEIEPSPGMTVLSTLFKIQEELDDSLSFRYSCRGAVCGACAMLIVLSRSKLSDGDSLSLPYK